MEYDLSITDMELKNITASWDEVDFPVNCSLHQKIKNMFTLCGLLSKPWINLMLL